MRVCGNLCNLGMPKMSRTPLFTNKNAPDRHFYVEKTDSAQRTARTALFADCDARREKTRLRAA